MWKSGSIKNIIRKQWIRYIKGKPMRKKLYYGFVDYIYLCRWLVTENNNKSYVYIIQKKKHVYISLILGRKSFNYIQSPRKIC